jgi:chemotaxis response regulator CheB
MKHGEKLFVVRKYVKAKSAADAIRFEKKQAPDDIWLDDEWKRNNADEP